MWNRLLKHDCCVVGLPTEGDEKVVILDIYFIYWGYVGMIEGTQRQWKG